MQSIFVHGLGQLSSSWLPVLSHLPANIPADCPDLTSLLACQEITYPGLYQAFSDYCDQQNSPLYLCGLSLGAVLSLNYTVEHPQKVKSLILIAPQYKMPRLLLSFFLHGSYFKNLLSLIPLKRKKVARKRATF